MLHLLCGEYNVVTQGLNQEVKRDVGAWSREVEEEVRRVELGGNRTRFMESKMRMTSSGAVKCSCPG